MSTEDEIPAQDANPPTDADQENWPKDDDNLKVEDIVHTDDPKPEKKASKSHKSKKHKEPKIKIDADSEIKTSESVDSDGRNNETYSINRAVKIDNDEADESSKKGYKAIGETVVVPSETKDERGLNLESEDKNIADVKEKVAELGETDGKDAKISSKDDIPAPPVTESPNVSDETAQAEHDKDESIPTVVLQDDNSSLEPDQGGKRTVKTTKTTYTYSSDKPIDQEEIVKRLKSGEKIEGVDVKIKEETVYTDKTETGDKMSEDGEKIVKDTQDHEQDSINEDLETPDSNKNRDPSVEVDHTVLRETLDNLDKEIEKLLKRSEEASLANLEPTKDPGDTIKDEGSDLKGKNLENVSASDVKTKPSETSEEAEYKPRRRRRDLDNVDKDKGSEPATSHKPAGEEGSVKNPKNKENGDGGKDDSSEYVPRRRRKNTSPVKTGDSPRSRREVVTSPPRNSVKDDVPRRKRDEASPTKADRTIPRSRRKEVSPSKTEDDSYKPRSGRRKVSDTASISNNGDDAKGGRLRESSPEKVDKDGDKPRSRRLIDDVIDDVIDDEDDVGVKARSRKDKSPPSTEDNEYKPRSRRTQITPDKTTRDSNDYVPRSRRKDISPVKTEENGYTPRRSRKEVSPIKSKDSDYVPRSRRRDISPVKDDDYKPRSRRQYVSPVKTETDDYIPKSRTRTSGLNSYDTDDFRSDRKPSSYNDNSYEKSPRKTYAAPSYSSLSNTKTPTAYSSYKPSYTTPYSSGLTPTTSESPLTKAKNDYFSMDTYYPGKYSSAPRGEKTLGMDPVLYQTKSYTDKPTDDKSYHFDANDYKLLKDQAPTENRSAPLIDSDSYKRSTLTPRQPSPYDFDSYKRTPNVRQYSPLDFDYNPSKSDLQPSINDYDYKRTTSGKPPSSAYEYDTGYRPLPPIGRSSPSTGRSYKPDTDYRTSSPSDLDDYRNKLRNILGIEPKPNTETGANTDYRAGDKIGDYERPYKAPSYSRLYDLDKPFNTSLSSSDNKPGSDLSTRSAYEPNQPYNPSTIYFDRPQRNQEPQQLESDFNTRYRAYLRDSQSRSSPTNSQGMSEIPVGRRSANPPEELLSTSVIPISEYVSSLKPRRRAVDDADSLDYLNLNSGPKRYNNAPLSYKTSLNYGRPDSRVDYDPYSYLREQRSHPRESSYRSSSYAPSPYRDNLDPGSRSHYLQRPYMPIFSQETALVKRAHQLINKIVADTKGSNANGPV